MFVQLLPDGGFIVHLQNTFAGADSYWSFVMLVIHKAFSFSKETL